MNGMMVIYILVALSAGIVGYLLWQAVVATGDMSSARFDLEGALGRDGRQKKPMDRFIDPSTLRRMRILAAALPAIVMPTLIFSCGISNPLVLVAAALVFGFAGWWLPYLRFRRLVRRRQRLFEKKILDLTMGLANALRSGLALPQSIDIVTAQMQGPMREEMDILRAEYQLGTDIGDAFERVAERMPCEEIRLLAAAVRLTLRTGASLADVLVDMTSTIRQRRAFQDKLLSLTEQGRFEGLALGLMPVVAFVILHIVRPEMMRALYTTPTGWTAIGIVCLLEALGFVTIRKICTVEV